MISSRMGFMSATTGPRMRFGTPAICGVIMTKALPSISRVGISVVITPPFIARAGQRGTTTRVPSSLIRLLCTSSR